MSNVRSNDDGVTLCPEALQMVKQWLWPHKPSLPPTSTKQKPDSCIAPHTPDPAHDMEVPNIELQVVDVLLLTIH